MTNSERAMELVEMLPEDYYEVALYEYGEEDYVEIMLVYGSVTGIVGTMDALLINSGYDDADWSKMSAAIDMCGETIVYMPDLTGPEYEVVVDAEMLELLMA